ncbi:hypothetical protein Aconfl_42000 [Algoriphagus confluentis]|uniref:DUF4177 domain-containing protein n=2 Tax=Algoriphagus confluentis TaxID=1697556 RepID=A0ABQ6PWF5_9BACT|nr:hypothetical protein Aconfl_42000 [Algoriphagus confluentis]
MGIGRSVIIDNQAYVDSKDFTTTRTEQNRNGQKDIRRKDVRIKDIEETKLLNFYSLPGINIENIASNDAMISSKINDLLEQGWTLEFVTSGVESDSGLEDGKGIFITRLFFAR